MEPNFISKPTTIKEQVYRMLKTSILNGTIKQGEWLQENKLAELYKVSRSPVREVLIRLVSEGLLENIPNKGVFVKKLTSDDIYKIFELREILERYAIEKAVKKATDEDIKKLNEIFNNMELSFNSHNIDEYEKLDNELHEMIFTICDNEMVSNIYKNLRPQVKSFIILSLNSRKRYDKSISEHRGLVEGITERNFEKAWLSDSEHLKQARDEILDHLQRLEK